MTPTHEAALDSARDSLGVLKEILSGLPDEAMSYVPVPDGNSLAVLTAHALSATKFLYACGSGKASSFLEYRNGERASSFEVKDGTVASLTAAIDAGLADFAQILSLGSEENLGHIVSWPNEEGAPVRTGALCLVHGAAHLREHVGHAELTRDLWLAIQSGS